MPNFAEHAAAMGAITYEVKRIADLKAAFAKARAADRTVLISLPVQPDDWTGGDSWWDVGVPKSVRAARVDAKAGTKRRPAATDRCYVKAGISPICWQNDDSLL